MVPNKKRYREGLIQFSREKRDRWTQKRLESSTSPLWLRVRPRRLPPRTVQDGNVDEFGRQRWQPVITTLRPPKRDDDALALDKSNLAQTLAKRVKPRLPIQRVIWRKETLWRHRLLLCPCRKRPSRRRSAKTVMNSRRFIRITSYINYSHNGPRVRNGAQPASGTNQANVRSGPILLKKSAVALGEIR